MIFLRTKNNLIFLPFLTYVLAINTEEFCKNISHEASFKGEINVCHESEYLYECRKNLCTKNQNSCVKYQEIENLLKILMESKSKLEMFETFNKNIKKCSDVEYKWQPAHICINKKKCHVNYEPVENALMIRLKKTVTCSCKNGKNHKLNCGKNFCAAHLEACRQFYFKKDKLIDRETIKKC